MSRQNREYAVQAARKVSNDLGEFRMFRGRALTLWILLHLCLRQAELLTFFDVQIDLLTNVRHDGCSLPKRLAHTDIGNRSSLLTLITYSCNILERLGLVTSQGIRSCEMYLLLVSYVELSVYCRVVRPDRGSLESCRT
jgi:hypothetical protein